MTTGVSGQLPDLSGLLSQRNTLEQVLRTLPDAFTALSAGGSDSPLVGVAGTFTTLGTRLDIDLSGLVRDLPQGLSRLSATLPGDALPLVDMLRVSYQQLQEVVQRPEQLVNPDTLTNLSDTALEITQVALSPLESRIRTLTGGMVNTDTLAQLRQVRDLITALPGDLPDEPAAALSLLAERFVGVPPALLTGQPPDPAVLLTALAPLQPDQVTTLIDPLQQQVTDTFATLVPQLTSFDVTNAAAYQQAQTTLDATEAAISAFLDGIATIYQQLQTLVDQGVWETIPATYRQLLATLDLAALSVPERSLQTINAELTAFLETLLERLAYTDYVTDLQARLTTLNQDVASAFARLPVEQVQQALAGGLEQVRQLIASIPLAQVRATVEQLLVQVQHELDALGLDTIVTTITTALQELETFVTSTFNAQLIDRARAALEPLLAQIEALQEPLTSLFAQLNQVLQQISSVMIQLENDVQSQIARLNDLLTRLDQLSFQPVSALVIGQIDQIQQRLQAINPQALSTAERLGIKGALAVLEAIDLQQQVDTQLKPPFDALEQQVLDLLADVLAIIEGLFARVEAFNPQTLLAPVFDVLDRITQTVAGLTAETLTAPLTAQLQQHLAAFERLLDDLAPGRLLAVLQAPFDQLQAFVARLDPAQWLQPVQALYDQIAAALAALDIDALFRTLEQRQQALFASVRATVLPLFNGLRLPEPLDALFGGLHASLVAVVEALLNDPGAALSPLTLNLSPAAGLQALAAPLEAAFDRLLALIPQDELLAVLNRVRTTITTILDTLNPQQFSAFLRSAQQRLLELVPALPPLPLPFAELQRQVQARISAAPAELHDQATALLSRLDALHALLDPQRPGSRTQQLTLAHERLIALIRQRITSIDITALDRLYTRVQQQLAAHLPALFFATAPLDVAQLTAGLRPTILLNRLTPVLQRFFAQAQPLVAALERLIQTVIAGVQRLVQAFNVRQFQLPLQQILDTLREQLQPLNPAELLVSLSTIFQRVVAPLEAFNPATLAPTLDATARRVRDTLLDAVRDLVAQLIQALDVPLARMRVLLTTLIDGGPDTTSTDAADIADAAADIPGIRTMLNQALALFQRLLDQLRQLVFRDILERLQRLVKNLGMSFDTELDRVLQAFTTMLAAIPV